MKRFVLIAIFLTAAGSSGVASAANMVLADWTFNKTNGYASGLPQDIVGGHNFQNPYGGTPTFGGAIGGPSSTSSIFDGTGGFYGTTAGSTTLPTENFAVDVHARVGTLAQGDLFSSAGGNTGQLQIGEDSSGNWIAYITNSGSNNTGTVLGTLPAQVNVNTDLRVTNDNGLFTFLVNGVAANSGVTPSTTFVGFGAIHVAVAPGGSGPSFNGAISDLTISTAPEPGTLVLFGLGAAGLFVVSRRRKV